MPSPTREDTAAGSRRADDGGAESRGRETRGDGRDLVCALEMELTSRSLSNKMDCVSCDDLLNRNCADSAEVSVPLSPMGKRATHMEGDDLCRLIDRKFLIEDKKRLCALALGTALVGILLMIIHAEICPYVYEPQQHASSTCGKKFSCKPQSIRPPSSCKVAVIDYSVEGPHASSKHQPHVFERLRERKQGLLIYT
ncbi:hypothetical protein CRENBAI_005337 [Crenichthys baileyi]|uniref:Uncharacterized protein n=1 Tax=Crenichthys baileyi TaxID=28760 RepID=A0AAV9QU62_9TELE